MSPTNASDPQRTTDHVAAQGEVTVPLGPAVPVPDSSADQRRQALPAVAGYEMLGIVGRGGMGVVYKARHLALKRTVALKMILAGDQAGEQERTRFKAEAQAVARLQHPGIVQIHEVGEHAGHPFCALEFVDGGSLAQKLAGHPLPARDAARLVEALARAMHLAHSHNVVHRDLKPANVLLTADGTPKVTDFGLARQLDSDSGQTRDGMVMGTPSYMAPEQASGRAHEAGPAADVYALGAILYECLTGRPPFRAASMLETLEQVRSCEPVPPSHLQPKVPRDLETVCLKCLRKEPERRYASGAELADELGRFLRNEPVLARPITRLERGWRWCRRNPKLAAALALAVFFLLGGAVVSTWFAVDADSERKKADSERKKAEKLAGERANALEDLRTEKNKVQQEKDHAVEERDRAKFVAYSFRLREAQGEIGRGNWDRASSVLATCDPKLCGWEHAYLLRQTQKLLFECSGVTGEVFSVAFSPDGKRIVSGGGPRNQPGQLKVWDAENGQEVLSLKGHASVVLGVAFSPDGKHIVSASADKLVKVWDEQTGEEILSLKGHTAFVKSVAYSPDGARIVSGSDDSTVKVWDARTGQEVLSLKGHSGAVFCVAFSLDSKRIASGGLDQTVKIWDARTGQNTLTITGHEAVVSSVAFSPDGTRILSGGKDFKVWDAGTGQVIMWRRMISYKSVAYSADGKRIVAGGSNQTLQVWDAYTGLLLLTLTAERDDVYSVAFSPDGKRIVSGGGFANPDPSGEGFGNSYGDVRVWNAQTDQGIVSLDEQSGPINSVAFSPDSTRLVSAGSERGKLSDWKKVWDPHLGQETYVYAKKDGTAAPGKVTVWDVQTNRPMFSLIGHSEQVRCVAFSPDGMHIVSASRDKTVKIWNAYTGREIRSLKGHTGQISSVAFSPDGKRIVSAGGAAQAAEMKVWDVQTGREIVSLQEHASGISSLAFSPDGTRIVSGGGGTTPGEIKVWDARTCQELLSLKGHQYAVFSVAFSPDGQRIVSGGGYNGGADPNTPGEVKVWDAKTGQEVFSLVGHTSYVMSVAYSRDGKRIISGGYEGTVKVWDARTGQEALSLKAHGGQIYSVAFSPDNNCIAAAGWNGRVTLWPARLGPDLSAQ